MSAVIPPLDPARRAGRTGWRLRVAEARDVRARARHLLGTTREDLPRTREIVAAAAQLSRLLSDATEGQAFVAIGFTPRATGAGYEHHRARVVLAELDA